MNNINTIFEKLETSSTICTCQEAMYLHRLYLSIEQSIENYFKTIGKNISNSSSYHKDLLKNYFDSFGLSHSDLFNLVDELRGFRHIFNKRADILEFVTANIETLKYRVLELKDKIIEEFGRII